MGIRLYEHNQAAYDSALALLAETGKAAVVHPTGTGKSFIGFKLCEDFPDRTVCWLSPSEYIFRTQLENLKAAGGKEPENIRFLTYARLSRMDQTELEEIKPDVVILDEFHRAGAAGWGAAVRALLKTYPHVPVLGLSATNIRYLDSQRDMAEELFDGNIASEMTLGEAIVRGILSAPKYVTAAFVYQKELERLKRRIGQTQSRAARDSAEKYYELLRRTLEKADGLNEIFWKHMEKPHGKYIVFTSNLESMNECLFHVPEWFGKVDEHPHVYTLYSPDPKTLQSFEEFKEDKDDSHLRLLFCIDALNEGIHVDDVDGVILFRPTASPTVYKQQIGRALSAGKTGTPVIFDIVNNFEGLYSIGSLEEEMQAAVAYYREMGEVEKIVTERFRVIDEVRDCRKIFNELEEALSAPWETMYLAAKSYFDEHGSLDVPVRYRTPEGYSLGKWLQVQRRVRSGKAPGYLDEERIKKLDAVGMRWESADDLSWERHYDACLAYRQEHGDLNVPGDYISSNGVRLGAWLQSIRGYRRYGIRTQYFTKEREQLLNDLGMVWNQPDFLWERSYEAAKTYFERNGNLDVPPGYSENGVNLYNWLSDLRKMYRNTQTAREKEEQNRILTDTPPMKKESGDCLGEMSAGGAEDPFAGVNGLSEADVSKNSRGTLTESQIAQMDALCMRWESKADLAWENGYARAREYYEEHGQADAPLNYVTPDGFKLGVWLSKCREKYVKGTLSKERISKLEEIGMVWNKSRGNDWEECYERAQSYYQEYGTLSIPGDYVADGIWLGKWVNEQRQILAGNREGKTLTDEQKEKLSSIGLTAEKPAEERWKRRYREVAAYYRANGNSRLPVGYLDSQGKNLYVWLVNQRVSAKSGKMSEERKQLLSEIGALSM